MIARRPRRPLSAEERRRSERGAAAEGDVESRVVEICDLILGMLGEFERRTRGEHRVGDAARAARDQRLITVVAGSDARIAAAEVSEQPASI